MVTNAKKVSNEFLKAVINLYCYCDEKDQCSLEISCDGYHDELNQENLDMLQVFKFTGFKSEMGEFYDDRLVLEGRAEYNYGCGHDNNFSKFEIDYFDTSTNIYSEGEALIYLNAIGDIVSNCNLSYETQREKNVIICNVTDKNFNLLKSIEKYNNNIDEFSKKLGLDDYEICREDLISA